MVAGVLPVTLRAWRNKNGLLASPERKGWNRFSVADLCVVRLVAKMTQSGFSAENAVEIAELLAVEFWMLLDDSVSSKYAFVTNERIVFANDLMRISEFVHDGPREEVCIFVDFGAIVAHVRKGLEELSSGAIDGTHGDED